MKRTGAGAFRIDIGVSGIAQIGANTAPADVVVRDLSESGFSFVASKDVEPFEGLVVRMTFTEAAPQTE